MVHSLWVGGELDVGAEAPSVGEGTEPLSPSWVLLTKLEVRVMGHSIWC